LLGRKSYKLVHKDVHHILYKFVVTPLKVYDLAIYDYDISQWSSIAQQQSDGRHHYTPIIYALLYTHNILNWSRGIKQKWKQ